MVKKINNKNMINEYIKIRQEIFLNEFQVLNYQLVMNKILIYPKA
jgi:hypothetical protein